MFVRPHLEFSVHARCPWLVKDIEIIEHVQQRAVNMVVGLNGRTYGERLKEISMLSLYDRRIRGDVIQVWKCFHGYCSMDSLMFQLVSEIHVAQHGIHRNH